jgi:dolichyl-diphosphooligosaccharide--protein glycosyltransferase/undecaprenyl-diphosphooligosaccharide--protein glycosyltransferase
MAMILSTNKNTILLILIAFLFSFSIRLIWVQQFSAAEQFKFNHQFMINTNDGYYYAEGARDILDGKLKEEDTHHDLSPVESAASNLTAWLAKILPISFETLLFYMPAFLGSLLVIPLILIGKLFGRLEVGFVGALLASIAHSYYNRTMVGYYDTDMLNIVLPLFLLWSLLWAIQTQRNVYLFITALDILLYRWWYPQSVALEFSFVGLIAVYAVYQYLQNKKSSLKTAKAEYLTYTLKLIAIMFVAMMMIHGAIRLALVIGLMYIFSNKKYDTYIRYILVASIIGFLASGGVGLIWGKLEGYVFKDSVSIDKEGLGLHFFTVMQTIREAGSIPFETFAQRISGDTVTFILSVIGYVWLVVRYRVMLLALPMVGLGFMAYGIPGVVSGGGLRFTIYAVPIMALGIGYLIVEISKLISTEVGRRKEEVGVVVRYAVMAGLTVLALSPNIQHIIEYKVPTVFTQQEVQILDRFKGIANTEDYVVTWWDYGYPIRYYSDVKTLIDGGKHGGEVNFPVSFILNAPQEVAAKMARLDVEYTEKTFSITDKMKEDDNGSKLPSNIEQMTLAYGYTDTNDFLTALEDDITLPAKTRDVYLYLPSRMMGIFPTIDLFSNLDLMSGDAYASPFFYVTQGFEVHGDEIDLGSVVRLFKESGELAIGDKTITLNRFISTEYDPEGKLHIHQTTIDPQSHIYVIFMANYHQFLVLDERMYRSLYIQLFVLENYDKNLFEPVILDPMAKIFKLKI